MGYNWQLWHKDSWRINALAIRLQRGCKCTKSVANGTESGYDVSATIRKVWLFTNVWVPKPGRSCVKAFQKRVSKGQRRSMLTLGPHVKTSCGQLFETESESWELVRKRTEISRNRCQRGYHCWDCGAKTSAWNWRKWRLFCGRMMKRLRRNETRGQEKWSGPPMRYRKWTRSNVELSCQTTHFRNRRSSVLPDSYETKMRMRIDINKIRKGPTDVERGGKFKNSSWDVLACKSQKKYIVLRLKMNSGSCFVSAEMTFYINREAGWGCSLKTSKSEWNLSYSHILFESFLCSRLAVSNRNWCLIGYMFFQRMELLETAKNWFTCYSRN